MKQYVDQLSGAPACWTPCQPRPGLSQRRIRDCSRKVHEKCGLGTADVVDVAELTAKRKVRVDRKRFFVVGYELIS